MRDYLGEHELTTADTNMQAGDKHLVDVSAGNVTLTLPSQLSEGDQFFVATYATTGTSHTVIARNGHTIRYNSTSLSTNDLGVDIGYFCWLIATDTSTVEIVAR